VDLSGGQNYVSPSWNAYPHSPNTAGLEMVWAVPFDEAIPVTSDHEWYAFFVVIDNARSVLVPLRPPLACTGCSTPVCIVFNTLVLDQGGGNPGVWLNGPPIPGGNLATWQGGSGANCSLVPAKRTTWGELKSLYR
jgi:hypothetical protein